MTDLTLGELIRRKRKAEGVNQADAAVVFGINQSTVAKWERGAGIRADKLPTLARWLGLPLSEVLALYHSSDDEVGTKIDLIVDEVQGLHIGLADFREEVALSLRQLQRSLDLAFPRAVRRRQTTLEPTR